MTKNAPLRSPVCGCFSDPNPVSAGNDFPRPCSTASMLLKCEPPASVKDSPSAFSASTTVQLAPFASSQSSSSVRRSDGSTLPFTYRCWPAVQMPGTSTARVTLRAGSATAVADVTMRGRRNRSLFMDGFGIISVAPGKYNSPAHFSAIGVRKTSHCPECASEPPLLRRSSPGAVWSD